MDKIKPPSSWVIPDWPAPESIRALVTTVEGFDDEPFNLGTHVGDDLDKVNKRRQQLTEALKLEEQIAWLNQVHGVEVVDYADASGGSLLDADACISSDIQSPCAVMTADCLPLLVTDKNGNQVAAIHAGWRGLQQGIIERAIAQFQAPRSELLVWLGPAISKINYEVDQFVYNEFAKRYQPFLESSFEFTREGERGNHYLFDLKQMAHLILADLGIASVYDSKICSFADERCFSHRQGEPVGRMASIIWKV